MKVLISLRAQDDLARIYGYLAARNLDAAERFKTEAKKALALALSGSKITAVLLDNKPVVSTCHAVKSSDISKR